MGDLGCAQSSRRQRGKDAREPAWVFTLPDTCSRYFGLPPAPALSEFRLKLRARAHETASSSHARYLRARAYDSNPFSASLTALCIAHLFLLSALGTVSRWSVFDPCKRYCCLTGTSTERTNAPPRKPVPPLTFELSPSGGRTASVGLPGRSPSENSGHASLTDATVTRKL